MKRLGPHAVLSLALVGLCAACNFIISANLGDYEVGDPKLSSAPCALVEAGATNTCSTCIETKCATELATACDKATGKEATWFRNPVKACAEKPEVTGTTSWGCSSFLDDAAVKIENPKNTEEQQINMTVCIRDNCLKGKDESACRSCTLTTKDTSGTEHALAENNCGKCIMNACKQLIVPNCNDSQVGFLRPCAFTSTTANKQGCQNAFQTDAGLSPTEREIRSCIQECRTVCDVP